MKSFLSHRETRHDSTLARGWCHTSVPCRSLSLRSQLRAQVPRQRDLLDSEDARRLGARGVGGVRDARLRALIADALQEEPSRRPTSADLFARLEIEGSARRRFATAMTAALL